jgi:hypothetical protein
MSATGKGIILKMGLRLKLWELLDMISCTKIYIKKKPLMNDLLHEIQQDFAPFRHVIVWGFPLHTHTHSYIHESWTKALQKAGLSWRWFHDDTSQPDFDFSSCCFITEGWADGKIPIRADCTYFVHNAINPSKYQIGRLIDLRFNVCEMHDFNNDFVLRETECHYLSLDTLYQVVHSDAGVAGRRGRVPIDIDYEVVYLYWATDLCPDEICETDAELPRLQVVHYVGSTGPYYTQLYAFKQYMEQKGIPVHLSDPWSTPLSTEKVRELIKKSYCSPDFRSDGNPEHLTKDGLFNGTNHLAIGYVPCRVFKTISYGQTGITNSKRVKLLLGDFVELAETAEEVFLATTKRMNDVAWRKECMRHVANRHTFMHRLRDLGRALRLGDTTRLRSCVTAFMDIGRDKIDNRTASNYKQFLTDTLLRVKDPFIVFLDEKHADWKPDILQTRSAIGSTKIITMTEFPLQRFVPKVTDILQNADFKPKYSQDITNILPEYALLNFSKFELVLNASEGRIRPCASDSYAWIDAGMARFFPAGTWTNNSLPKKFAAQVDTSPSRPKIGSLVADSYIGSNECVVKGGMLVCTLESCKSVHFKVVHILEAEMIAKHRIDNEQIAMALVAQENPDLFELGTEVLQRFFTKL